MCIRDRWWIVCVLLGVLSVQGLSERGDVAALNDGQHGLESAAKPEPPSDDEADDCEPPCFQCHTHGPNPTCCCPGGGISAPAKPPPLSKSAATPVDVDVRRDLARGSKSSANEVHE
eukprot:TRINITY_DN5513_c0_g1_i1.p1 TRINITY_DN5513_c0_g1~~TRINITY_DN5513_c0_g1_i1.p1  ORF type:complete len:117 (-),score=22.31 TRINITY_DN5513_c0_g1_i1:283-633(-)